MKWVESSFVFDKPRFGALEHPRSKSSRGGWIVLLASALQKEPPKVLEWVLWREAILSLLLPQIRQINEAADLGLFGCLKFCVKNPKHREHFKKIWQQISPPQYFPDYQYNPVLGFPMFDYVVEGEFLQRVIPWLNAMRTIYQTPIASTTYTAALERWMLETHCLLNETEVRILLALASKPFPTQHQIAEQLGLSPATISYALNNLAQKHLLRLFNFINLPLIGLNRYAVLLNVPNEETYQQLQDLFSKMQYGHSIKRISDTALLFTFLIPNPYVDKFQTCIKQLCEKKDLLKPQIHLVTDLIQSRNFQYYSPNVGWPNDFSFLLDKIYHNVLESSIHDDTNLRISKYDYDKSQFDSKFPIRLLPEDFTYFLRSTEIVSMTDHIISRSSKEAEEAGLDDSMHMRYRRRVQSLEELEVSTLRGFGLIHIGLNAGIDILLKESRESTIQLLGALQLLPYVNALIFDDGISVIFLQIPSPVGVDVYSSLRAILAECDYDAKISLKSAWKTFVGLPSPIIAQNYDFNKGEWIWVKNSLPELE